MSVSWLAQQEVFTAFCGLGLFATCVPAYWQLEGESLNPRLVRRSLTRWYSLERWRGFLDSVVRNRMSGSVCRWRTLEGQLAELGASVV